MTHQNLKTWWAVAGICGIAFILIAILAAQIFEHIPHSEDEVAYIFQAKVFAQNRLSVPTPPFDEVFWSPFVLDSQGRRFGKYPPGWPLLLSLGVRLDAPWMVNALLGIVTLALIAWLGQQFYGQKSHIVPLIAAGAGLITPGFLFLSGSLLSHSASLFWNTLALAALFQITRQVFCENRPLSPTPLPQGEGSRAGNGVRVKFSLFAVVHLGLSDASRGQMIYALLLGIFLGLAFITRPLSAVGIGLVMGIFLLALIVKKELKWQTLFWVIGGGLPIAALLPLYWWAITGDPTFNAYVLVWPYDRLGFGPDIGPYGYDLHTALFINTRLKLGALATGLFGWPGWTNLIFIPIPFLTRRANRWDWLLLGTILSLIFVHIFYWSFGGVDGGFPRYYYDALPALLLLTARGIEISFQFLHRWRVTLPLRSRSMRLSWLLVGAIIAFVGYSLAWRWPPLLAAQKGKYGITPAPLRLVAQADLTEPALILVKDVDIWSDFAVPFAANSPTLDGPIIFAIDWNDELARQLRAYFSDRECWELLENKLERCP